jgi:hypothetical protein
MALINSIARVTDFQPVPCTSFLTHFLRSILSGVKLRNKTIATPMNASTTGISTAQNAGPPFRISPLLTKKVAQNGSCTQDILRVRMIEL